jgi:DNA modification methylase
MAEGENKIFVKDCLEGMKELPDNCVDAVITDPPYELGFMGKSWDKSGIAINVDMWRQVLRVLKPGGHLLSFGGSRTYHRMACAIEDAGFEIRDMIEWVYGSGFPKSFNISLGIDKQSGAIRDVIGVRTDGKATNSGSGCYQMNDGKDTSMKKVFNETAPKTDAAKQWEGWGTALKPAHEPIVLARKPLSEKTVVENVLKWGVGGLNIAGCRIKHNEPMKMTNRTPRTDANIFSDESCGFKQELNHIASAASDGRFPANFIHDGSDEVMDEFGEASAAARFFYCAKASKSEREKGCESMETKEVFRAGHGNNEEDDVSKRFITKIKNNHPTVKPLALMEYLIKMVTPQNGVVLDPFLGSGTTAIAAVKNGCKFIGFEMNKEYCKIAVERIKPFLKK